MFEDEFDPYEALMGLIDNARAQANIVNELTKSYNRHERMLHHLSAQNDILKEQHDIDRQQIVRMSMAISELLDATK